LVVAVPVLESTSSQGGSVDRGAPGADREDGMSNKDWKKLNRLDQLIRRTLRLGITSGTFLTIEYVYGFELFTSRPYHNYETWAGGYRVTDARHHITVEREDLDDALQVWATRVEAARVEATALDAGRTGTD
jgi:hypothetical protein